MADSSSSGERSGGPPLVSTVAVACAAVFSSYLQISSVVVALTAMGRGLHASTSDLQWVYDAFTIPVAALILSAGVIGDVLGRKRVTVVGLVLVAAGCLISLCAPSVQVVWIGRAVAGVGSAGLLPATLALISHAVPEPSRRPRYVAMWATSLNLALATGPFMAGSILALVGWRWIFLPMAAVAAATAVVAVVVLEDSKAPGARQLDWPGQAAAAISIAALAYGVIEGGASGWASAGVLAALVAAVLALAVFIWIERRSPSPMLRLDLFRSGAFSGAVVSGFMAMFSLIGAMFVLSLFLGGAQRRTPLGIAVVLIFVYGATTIVGQLTGRFLARTGPDRPLVAGLLCCAAGMFALGRIGPAVALGGLAAPLLVTGVGFGLVLTSVTSAAVNAVPNPLVGMASAAINAFRQTGAAVGAAVLGVIFTAGTIKSLNVQLASARISQAARIVLRTTISRHGAIAHSTLPGVTPLLNEAVAAGLHLAVNVSAIAMLAAALLFMILSHRAGR